MMRDRHQSSLLRYIHPLVMPNTEHLMFIGSKDFVLTWFQDMPIQHDLFFDNDGLLSEECL